MAQETYFCTSTTFLSIDDQENQQGNIRLVSGANQDTMVIDSGGNVGIGTGASQGVLRISHHGAVAIGQATALYHQPNPEISELLERIKRIEDLLGQIIEVNAAEVEEHERWKAAFDSKLKSLSENLDAFEELETRLVRPGRVDQ